MVYIYEISDHNKEFESILFDWLNKNKELDSIDYFNMSSCVMRDNYLIDFLHDLYSKDCDIENKFEKEEYIDYVIRGKSIKDALTILLKYFKIKHIKLLIVEEDFISNVTELTITSI